jgi:hypothetical protein
VQVKVQRKARSHRTEHCHGQEAELEVGRRSLLAEQEVIGGALLLAGGALLLAGGAPGDGSSLCVDPAHLCSQ